MYSSCIVLYFWDSLYYVFSNEWYFQQTHIYMTKVNRWKDSGWCCLYIFLASDHGMLQSGPINDMYLYIILICPFIIVFPNTRVLVHLTTHSLLQNGYRYWIPTGMHILTLDWVPQFHNSGSVLMFQWLMAIARSSHLGYCSIYLTSWSQMPWCWLVNEHIPWCTVFNQTLSHNATWLSWLNFHCKVEVWGNVRYTGLVQKGVVGGRCDKSVKHTLPERMKAPHMSQVHSCDNMYE